MHPKLRALFDEHEKPTHASKRDVHDAAGPLARMVGMVQKQVIEYRIMLADIENAPHDHEDDGHYEEMHQTFGAIERESAAAAQSIRNLAKWFTQLDRYMANAKAAPSHGEAPPAASGDVRE